MEVPASLALGEGLTALVAFGVEVDALLALGVGEVAGTLDSGDADAVDVGWTAGVPLVLSSSFEQATAKVRAIANKGADESFLSVDGMAVLSGGGQFVESV